MVEAENKPSELTEEQERIIEDIYGYTDKAAYTEEDIAMAKQMFDTPEKFRLLRKILQVFTIEERGLSIPDPLNNISAESFEKLGIEVAIQKKADEKIRSSLVSFYLRLRKDIQQDKREELEKQNIADFVEQKKTEKFLEEKEEANRVIGVNL